MKKPTPQELLSTLFQNLDKNKLCNILELTDKLISGKISLKVLLSQLGLAYTDNKDIYLDFYEVLKFCKSEQDFLIITKGLNYHELAHIIYTDYDIKKIRAFFKTHKINDERTYKQLLNLLEDTRIENLFSLKFEKLIDYFCYTANKIIIQDLVSTIKSNSMDSILISYLSLYGRKFLYLDSKKRKILNKIRTHIKKEIKDLEIYEKLVNDYNSNSNLDIRLKIALELYKLFEKNNQTTNHNRKNTNIKPTLTPQEKQDLKDKLKEMEKSLKKLIDDIKDKQTQDSEQDTQDTDSEQDEDEQDEDEDEDSEQEKTGKKKKGKKEKQDEQDEDEQDTDSEQDTQDTDSEQDTNTNQHTPTDKSTDDLRDDDFKIFEDLDKQTQQDIKEDLKQVFNTDSERVGFDITNEHKTQIQQITNTLKILNNDLGNSIKRNQKKGRFDVRSFIQAQNNNNSLMFKQLQDNTLKNKSKLAISILLDKSISMKQIDLGNKNSNFDIALSSTYILSKSLENTGNKTEVLSFSEYNGDYNVLKEFNKMGNFEDSPTGLTYLTMGLNKAIEDLNTIKAQEKINNRFIFIISDGFFGDKPYDLLKEIKDKNEIKVIWVFVNRGEINEMKKTFFHYVLKVDNFNNLNRELNKIIYDIQKGINENLKQGLN
jgi:hypothetical protein